MCQEIRKIGELVTSNVQELRVCLADLIIRSRVAIYSYLKVIQVLEIQWYTVNLIETEVEGLQALNMTYLANSASIR